MQLCLHTLLPHHFVLVIGAEEHAPWPPIELVVVETGPANSGGVYNGSHLCEVIQQHFVEEGLIPVLCWHAFTLAKVFDIILSSYEGTRMSRDYILDMPQNTRIFTICLLVKVRSGRSCVRTVATNCLQAGLPWPSLKPFDSVHRRMNNSKWQAVTFAGQATILVSTGASLLRITTQTAL